MPRPVCRSTAARRSGSPCAAGSPPRARFIPHRIACRLGLPDPQDGDDGCELVRLLAQALDGVVQRHGAHIVFMPTYCTTEEGDDRLAAAVAEAMRAPRSSSIVMLDEPALYKACCGMFNLLIGGRMHPAILAAAMGTPVIGLAYNPKFRGAFELLGTPDRWIDVEWFVRNGCVERLNGLIDAAIDGGRLPVEPVASLVRRIQNFHRQLSGRFA